jgi:hypothetical protein
MELYDIGDEIELRAVFTRQDTGGAIVPGAVVCKVREPDDTIVTVTTVADTTVAAGNVFLGSYVPTKDGPHEYHFQGTAPAAKAEQGAFRVRRTVFT